VREHFRSRLAPVFTARFVKFCTVGASGVVVNFAVLGLLTTLGVHNNVASALAIELSILSNFAVNFRWTFADKREAGGTLMRQCGRFHLVSLGGALIQFSVFVVMNMLWFAFLAGSIIVIVITEEVPVKKADPFWPLLVGAVCYTALLLGTEALDKAGYN